MKHDSQQPQHLSPGRQPYDALVGARVGAVSGGLVAAAVVALVGAASFWWVLVGAAVGGFAGFRYESLSGRGKR